jgi:hypothetical protein
MATRHRARTVFHVATRDGKWVVTRERRPDGEFDSFETKDEAIRAIYARLNVATCAACAARVFNECQRLLPDGTAREPDRPDFALASRGGTG